MRYTLKIWLTAVVGTPILLLAGIPLFTGEFHTYYFTLCTFLILFGALLSLPAIIIFHLLHINMNVESLARKIMLSLVAIVSIYGTFMIMFMTEKSVALNTYLFPLLYCATTVFSIWFYKTEVQE